MNDRFAVDLTAGNVMDFGATTSEGQPTIRTHTFYNFEKLHNNDTVIVQQAGKEKTVELASAWLKWKPRRGYQEGCLVLTGVTGVNEHNYLSRWDDWMVKPKRGDIGHLKTCSITTFLTMTFTASACCNSWRCRCATPARSS
jgi:hypothetical protein